MRLHKRLSDLEARTKTGIDRRAEDEERRETELVMRDPEAMRLAIAVDRAQRGARPRGPEVRSLLVQYNRRLEYLQGRGRAAL